MAAVLSLADLLDAGRDTLTVREAEEIAAKVDPIPAMLAAFERPQYVARARIASDFDRALAVIAARPNVYLHSHHCPRCGATAGENATGCDRCSRSFVD